MKKYIYVLVLSVACAAVAFVSCEETDEVPPVEKTVASKYKMPDPEPLSDADREAISAMEKEYNENAN